MIDFNKYNGLKTDEVSKRDVFGYGHDQPILATQAWTLSSIRLQQPTVLSEESLGNKHWVWDHEQNKLRPATCAEVTGEGFAPGEAPMLHDPPAMAGDMMVHGADGKWHWVSLDKAQQAFETGARPPRVLCEASPYPAFVDHVYTKHPGQKHMSGTTHSDEDAVSCNLCGMCFVGGPTVMVEEAPHKHEWKPVAGMDGEHHGMQKCDGCERVMYESAWVKAPGYSITTRL